MESNQTSCLPQKRPWILRQSINREHLKSCSGILSVFEMVTLVTGFSALLHYVKIVSKTTVTNHVFFVTTGAAFVLKLMIFASMIFNLQQKFPTFNKHWTIFMAIFTTVTAVLLLISSSLLASEASDVGDVYHSSYSSHIKCVKCSKINIAAVFGCISCILFIIDFCVHMRQNDIPFLRVRRETRVTVCHVSPAPNENEQQQGAAHEQP